MARIPDAELERLKRDVRLEPLVAAKGVTLARHGADLIGRCPFHDDRTPSLVVSPKKNLWHCLGACQAGGSVIDWVMRAEGVSFRHAVELLRKEAPALAAERTAHGERSRVSKMPALITSDLDDQSALRQVVDYYHATLKESPEAKAYLDKRGLVHPELIESFQLGYANRTLGYRLPSKTRAAGAELRGQLQKLGVLRDTGHEHFRGSLVIPILGQRGEVLGMYGRKISSDLRDGTPLHLYLPGPHRGVFNGAALGACEEVILCEALIDALTFWCAGFRNVTSAYGVEGFTNELLEALRHKRVLIAYDTDDAGNRAAAKLAERLGAEGIACKRVLFPKGMDANAYALAVQPAKAALAAAIEGAEWMGSPPLSRRVAPPRLSAPPSPASGAEPACDVTDDELTMCFGPRRWRVRGLAKSTSPEILRVNVLCAEGERFHVDTCDLYAARQRAAFLRQAAGELAVEEAALKRELGRVLLRLEAVHDERLRAAAAPTVQEPLMTEAERDEALALLCSPDLLARILGDFERAGVVGEETNKLVGYLAAVSRKLEEPLAVVIQSSSAAGKSSLMDAILALVPPEERVKYSAMTGQSLFYMGEQDLAHRILAIVEEEGAERASYALKLLQSEGELTIASTGKDPATGRLVTHEYRVLGPVMIFLTTTALEIDEELANRCIVLTVNEERTQTRAIHERQRQAQTLAGLIAKKERSKIQKLHQNAQRLLRPLLVANPYAERLTFLDDRTRTRRDHMKYLTLIRTLALLHQHQREVKTTSAGGEPLEYIEVTPDDIATANRLAAEVLVPNRDELPPQTRRLLELVDQMVQERCGQLKKRREEVRFSRREVREHSGWSLTQTRVHLERLVALEYVAVHRGGRGQSFVYELTWSPKEAPERLALADVNLAGGGGGMTAGWRSEPARQKSSQSKVLRETSRPDGSSTSRVALPSRSYVGAGR